MATFKATQTRLGSVVLPLARHIVISLAVYQVAPVWIAVWLQCKLPFSKRCINPDALNWHLNARLENLVLLATFAEIDYSYSKPFPFNTDFDKV